MKRCGYCGCIAFDDQVACGECGFLDFVSVQTENLTLRDGIRCIAAMEPDAPYDEKRCLFYLTDIIPNLQREQVMLGTAFRSGAISSLRAAATDYREYYIAIQQMKDSGMNDGAIATVLEAYGFASPPQSPMPPMTDPPIAQPAPAKQGAKFIAIGLSAAIVVLAIVLVATRLSTTKSTTNKTVYSSTKEQTEDSSESASQHRYEVVREDISWTDANAACKEKGGHLATITSQEEFDTIVSLAEKNELRFVWLGGRTASGSTTNDGEWITGEPFTFTAWYPGEPSHKDLDGTPESYIELWYVNDSEGWSMNDERDRPFDDPRATHMIGKIGYVCEYEA